MLLGAIADDFTGATDLCSMLVRGGMRTVQLIGVPSDADAPPDADAVVVALKSRTAPVREAVQQSLAALAWLQRAGCRQFFFKYCSTFDSTEQGNIGPVADALVDALGCGFALACPAFPTNARTVYQGHLFVGGTLLNESGMEHHPLTPMTDANLVRVLARQTDGTVGLVPFATVDQGATAIRDAMTALKEQGRRYADRRCGERRASAGDRRGGARACADHRRLRRGDGAAGEFPPRGTAAGASRCRRFAGRRRARRGARRIVLARDAGAARHGARRICRCSNSIRWRRPMPRQLSAAALDWAAGKLGATPMVIAASAPPDKVAAAAGEAGTRRRRRVDRRMRWRASPRAWWRTACAASSWRAARPPARWCTRLGVRSLRIGAGDRSRRALDLCARAPARRCCWRSSPAISARPDFFLKAFQVLEG